MRRPWGGSGSLIAICAPGQGTRLVTASGAMWSAAATGDGAAHGPPPIVGTLDRALAAPSELHPAGRR
jgi:hypothetical protein